MLRCAWRRLSPLEPCRMKRTPPANAACSDKITETESHGDRQEETADRGNLSGQGAAEFDSRGCRSDRLFSAGNRKRTAQAAQVRRAIHCRWSGTGHRKRRLEY